VRPDDPSPPANRSQVTLTIAYGLTTGQAAQAGLRQVVGNIVGEGLMAFSRDGRPQARLAQSSVVQPDGLSIRIQLRNGARFHDESAVTADAVREILARQLKAYLGPAFKSVKEIRVVSPLEVEVALNQRSAFAFEGLDLGIQPPGSDVGTGPFKIVKQDAKGVEMAANQAFYGGKPAIDRILIKPYDSVRAAWADMLRGQADMLYEVGPDAIEILQPSKAVRVISHLRNYQYMGILNLRQPKLKDPGFRRALNAAIDRQSPS